MLQYTIPQIAKAIQYKQNNQVENYSNPIGNILALSFGTLILLLFINLALWLFALFALITNWKKLPLWLDILCLALLFLFAPIGHIITLILVYTMKTDYNQQ